MDQVVRFRAGCNELVHLFTAEMLTVSSMIRVRDWDMSIYVRFTSIIAHHDLPSLSWRSSSSNRPCFRPICNWIVFPPCDLPCLNHSFGTEWVSLTTYGDRAMGVARTLRAAKVATSTANVKRIMKRGDARYTAAQLPQFMYS
jgi:hypothetical protein